MPRRREASAPPRVGTARPTSAPTRAMSTSATGRIQFSAPSPSSERRDEREAEHPEDEEHQQGDDPSHRVTSQRSISATARDADDGQPLVKP